MQSMARRIDADAIYVSKPRFPSLGLGVLAKEHWNRPLIVDIDDFEPSFFEEERGVDVRTLLAQRRDPDLALPFGRMWTRACEDAIGGADVITVSNRELEHRYGGVIVPHARDETIFDPERFDRVASRRRLGLHDDDRLILFGGTPRVHKGIIEILEALDTIGDQRLRLGVFGTVELRDLRRQIGSLERWILPLPYISFDELPHLLAAADLTCALQSPNHPVSAYQMPAKVTDAMAMGVPCLVTPVPPLRALIDKDVVEVFDPGDQMLHERLRQVFESRDETLDRAARAREVFLESYSYAAVAPVAAEAIERHLDDAPPVAPALSSLVDAAREVSRSSTTAVSRTARRAEPTPRRPMPDGSTYDLVIFWKQNDTGIYGRRQDMLLKYLDASGRFGTIVHFDQPMSVEGLARLAGRSTRRGDQNRLVLRQTLRRLARRSDHGRIRHRTFVYAAGRRSKKFPMFRREQHAEWVREVLRLEGIGPRPVVFWAYPTNSFFPPVADLLAPDVIVADVVDDNRTWYTPGDPVLDLVEQNYAEVLGRADIVLANCQPVATSMQQFTEHVEVIGNACELPDRAGPGPRPPELRDVRGPIIGYAGNLSDRIDIDLLRSLAQMRSDWTFVFLGSAHLDRSALTLAELPNVLFIGTEPYEQAREIIRHFDVGLIPHIDNAMTRSMNPLKAYVYCSLGVPIVSAPVANLEELAEFITIARGPSEFVEAIEAALRSQRPAPDRTSLRPHSWSVRVDRVLELIDGVVEARRAEAS
jgi:glycosyltransferase involved in cell wall biosynthesis